MLKGMWDGYQTSMAYGLSMCPNQEITADIGSFVDDRITTKHGVDEAIVEVHEEMRNNLIKYLREMGCKTSKGRMIIGRRKQRVKTLLVANKGSKHK